jgi:PIN domain nuclease of toxin-antitoxin system
MEMFETEKFAVSIISLWEIAKLSDYKRLVFDTSVEFWLREAILYPEIEIVNLNIDIIPDATDLPGSFHKDPADQLIVATSRILKIPLVTLDEKILKYPHVNKLG